MNTSEIEVLLEKFYEGNTSLQEEQTLRNFFLGTDVPAHLKLHQRMFHYFVMEQRQEAGDADLNQKFMAQVIEKPGEALVVPLHSNRSRFLFIAGIAASILLLVGLFFTFQHAVFNRSKMLHGDQDPELSYANASEALMMVSGNLNTGIRQIEKLQMVDKAMKNVQLFNKFYQYQTIIINPDEISDQSIKSK